MSLARPDIPGSSRECMGCGWGQLAGANINEQIKLKPKVQST